MTISNLSMSGFRCFDESTVTFDPRGLTVLRGLNGTGKTSVLEAVGWLATGRSIRSATRDALVKRGSGRAILRAQTTVECSDFLMEAEIPLDRASRVQVNRRAVRRRAELVEALRVSVFSPADRRLVEGGPALRRDYLDEVLAERHARLESLVNEVELVLRQRSALLRQSAGRPDDSVLDTLDVWDDRLASSGTALAEAREALVVELEPLVRDSYTHFAGRGEQVSLVYRRSWPGDLATALEGARGEDLRRQLTTFGPHRDELEIELDRSPARTHASQGEQRCLALSLRMATHDLRRRGAAEAPVLLLDDVFSELDPYRSAALVERLAEGQVLLTTAVDPPALVGSSEVIDVGVGGLVGGSSEQ